MGRFRRLLLILLTSTAACLTGYTSVAAVYTYSRSYTVENGLPSNAVYGIVQDRTGFIWFGTTNGLCRFDGHEFHTYQYSRQSRNTISSNSIRRIMIDSRNQIWISLDNGVDIYDPVTDTFILFFNKKIPKRERVYRAAPSRSSRTGTARYG